MTGLKLSVGAMLLAAVIQQTFQDETWFITKIKPSYFEEAHNLKYHETAINITSILNCGSKCDVSDWCLCWCYDHIASSCLLSNMAVSPFHADSDTDAKICYTRLRPDLLFGAGTRSSELYYNSKNSGPKRLVEGIYNYNVFETCMILSGKWRSWVHFRIRESAIVKQVQVTTYHYLNEKYLPHGAVIRVGNEDDPSDDFSSYAELGRLPLSVEPGITYSVYHESGIAGQFLAIETHEDRDQMIICYLQVFSTNETVYL